MARKAKKRMHRMPPLSFLDKLIYWIIFLLIAGCDLLLIFVPLYLRKRIAFSEETGIPELRRTTRDEPDYDKLMKYRLDILKEHGLGLKEIQETIAKIEPLPGAKAFLDELRRTT